MALSQGMLRRRSAHRPTFTSEGPARPHWTETWSEEQARTRAVPVPLLARWRGHGKSLGHAPPVGGPAFIPLPEGRGLSPGLKLRFAAIFRLSTVKVFCPPARALAGNS